MSATSPTQLWQLHSLGALRLERQGQTCTPARKKARALLLLLVLGRRPQSRDSLASWFWPDLENRQGRTSLRSTLSDLNRILGNEWVVHHGDALSFNEAFPVAVDALQLMEARRQKRILPLEQLYSWSGELAEGFRLPGCDAFEEWLYFQRGSLRQAFLELMELKVASASAHGEWDTMAGAAKLWISCDPLSEKAHLALMQALTVLGRVDQALDQYRVLESALQNELGVKPAKGIEDYVHELKQNRLPTSIAFERPDETHSPEFGDVAYARNGDLHIAYREIGKGPDVLIYLWGFISHLDQATEEPRLLNYITQLSRRYRLILFDKRGMGLSDRTGHPPSLAETASDVIALMDHLKIHSATLLGQSEGGPAAVTCAHRYPDRIERLILVGTAAKWTSSPDYPHTLAPELYDKWLDVLESSWGHAVNLKQFAPSCAGDEKVIKWWSKTLRLASSPGAVRAVLEVAKDIDVRHLLPDIRQPCLIVQIKGDRLIRADNGRFLAEEIPGSSYLELPGHDHWLWVQETEQFFKSLDVFRGRDLAGES